MQGGPSSVPEKSGEEADQTLALLSVPVSNWERIVQLPTYSMESGWEPANTERSFDTFLI